MRSYIPLLAAALSCSAPQVVEPSAPVSCERRCVQNSTQCREYARKQGRMKLAAGVLNPAFMPAAQRQAAELVEECGARRDDCLVLCAEREQH